MSSAYREAVLDDPEVAERLAVQPEPVGRSRTPALSEFSPVVAALTDALDLLQVIHGDLVALGNGKPPQFRPTPRPVTGVQRARARIEERQHLALVDEVREAQRRWAANKREAVRDAPGN